MSTMRSEGAELTRGAESFLLSLAVTCNQEMETNREAPTRKVLWYSVICHCVWAKVSIKHMKTVHRTVLTAES
jgi:hypothetical protein